jgi:hypothetical protein
MKRLKLQPADRVPNEVFSRGDPCGIDHWKREDEQGPPPSKGLSLFVAELTEYRFCHLMDRQETGLHEAVSIHTIRSSQRFCVPVPDVCLVQGTLATSTTNTLIEA